MACKIEKSCSLEQGKDEYLLLTADFGSLQMRLTTQDTVLDSKDGQTPDEGLYEIYKEGSVCGDAHSHTGNNIFCNSVNGQVYNLELEDGSTYSLYQEMSVYINTGSGEKKVKVTDLKESDDIVFITDDEGKSVPKVDYNF